MKRRSVNSSEREFCGSRARGKGRKGVGAMQKCRSRLLHLNWGAREQKPKIRAKRAQVLVSGRLRIAHIVP